MIKLSRLPASAFAFAALLVLIPPAALAGMIPIATDIPYQGRLALAGAPVNGQQAMSFRLYNDMEFGSQIGDTYNAVVEVVDGLFAVALDFGPEVTWNEGRFLEIEVEGQVLVPRQPLRPTPFALRSLIPADDFPEGFSTLEARLSSRPVGAVPESASFWTMTSIRQEGSLLPELSFYAPFSPGLGNPGRMFAMTAGSAVFGRADFPVNLAVRGNLTGHGQFTQVGNASFQNQVFVTGRLGSGTTAPTVRLDLRGSDGDDLLSVRPQSGLPALYIPGNGRLGVGRDSGITDRLHVLAALGENPLRIQTSMDGGGQLTAFRVFANAGASIGINSTPPERGLLVQGQSRFVGRVGIGTAEPQVPLHVLGPFGQSGALPLMRVDNDNGVAFRVTAGGSVVVGNVPNESHPVGGGLVTEGIISVRTLHFAGSIVPVCIRDNGALTNCSSTQRLKKDIENLESASALLRRLRPVQFRWTETGREDVGLIAEEVAEVEERLAIRDGSGELVGVNYAHLAAVLVAALQESEQELAVERAKQEARIAALEAELRQNREEAERRLANLEQLLLSDEPVRALAGQH